ncbi:MAG: c-type cytochrome [Gammaproteobacteria bacterium]|nr:c-type cytochrome [Gammaproteobacteria bacterium]MCY4229246.1 c-type cytochrome [Gammaproteobacteria bacterium]
MAAAVLLFNPAVSQAEGDIEAGKAKSALCVACHGVDGNSPVDQFPKIAGQVPGYVAVQLQAYKTGARENAVMLGIVGSLSEQDMADLDAYYASQAPSIEGVSEEDMEEVLAGQQLYRAGYAGYDVPACMACHGPDGSGIPPHYPRLGGQHVAYTEMQLHAFKSGARKNVEMQAIAHPLTGEQIRQLALYISALQP